MNKKFDAQAAKKIINEYADWVNYYIKGDIMNNCNKEKTALENKVRRN